MLHNPLLTWSCEVSWPIKIKYILFCKTYGHQTWQDGGLWQGKLSHDVTLPFNHLIMRGHMTNWKFNISSSEWFMIPKVCMLVVCNEGNSLTTPSCKITWQTNDEISSLSQCLWASNVGGWWLIMKRTHP